MGLLLCAEPVLRAFAGPASAAVVPAAMTYAVIRLYGLPVRPCLKQSFTVSNDCIKWYDHSGIIVLRGVKRITLLSHDCIEWYDHSGII